MHKVKAHHIANIAAAALLYILYWCIYRDYPVTYDEPTHLIDHVDQYFSQWTQIFRYGYVKYLTPGMSYGSLFNVPVDALLSGLGILGRFSTAAYTVKHNVTFHVSMLCYIALGYALFRAYAYRYALALAITFLALHPSFFGFSAFNPKDSPFAAFYTFATIGLALSCCKTVEALGKGAPLGYYKMQALEVALWVALASGVRIAGMVILPCWLCLLCLMLGRARLKAHRNEIALLLCYTGMFAFLFLLVIYPAVVSNPFKWFYDTARLFNMGTFWPRPVPAYYVPLHFFLKTPLPILVFGIAGLIAFAIEYRQSGSSTKAIGLMMAAQLLTLPALMIIFKTRTYHGDRHIIFVYPALAYFSAHGFMGTLRMFQPKKERIAFMAAMTFLSLRVTGEMAYMHPYEYYYFNEIGRNTPVVIEWYKADRWQYSTFWNTDTPLIGWLDKNMPGMWRVRPDADIRYNPYKGRHLEFVRRVEDADFVLHSQKRKIRVCPRIYEEYRDLAALHISIGHIDDCRTGTRSPWICKNYMQGASQIQASCRADSMLR